MGQLIKFLKDFTHFKKGDKTTLSDDISSSLIRRGIVVKANEDEKQKPKTKSKKKV